MQISYVISPQNLPDDCIILDIEEEGAVIEKAENYKRIIPLHLLNEWVNIGYISVSKE